jgi:hypothetical protein
MVPPVIVQTGRRTIEWFSTLALRLSLQLADQVEGYLDRSQVEVGRSYCEKIIHEIFTAARLDGD